MLGQNTSPLVPNMGQLKQSNGTNAPSVKYYTISPGHSSFFHDTKISHVFSHPDSSGTIDTLYRTDMEFLGCNPTPSIYGLNAQGKVNFYTGGVAVSGANLFTNITYNNLYSGINLKCTGLQQAPQLEYTIDLNVANPSVLQMKWVGASNLAIINNNLVITTPLGQITYQQPTANQVINGQSQSVSANFVINGQTVSIIFGNTNVSYGLVVVLNPAPSPYPNPVMYTYGPDWVTYVEGANNSAMSDVDIDATNNLYMTGNTSGAILPSIIGTSPLPFAGNRDAFIIKFNSFRQVEWWTYFGGSNHDYGANIKVRNGYVYTCGKTNSSDITTWAATAQQPVSNTWSTFNGDDLFILKLAASTGQLGAFGTFWSYFGGTGVDEVFRMDIDINNNVYIAGNTSGTIPALTKSGAYNYNPTAIIGQRGFFARFVPFGNALQLNWCTAIEGDTWLRDLVVKSNTVYVLGATANTASPVQTSPCSTNVGGALFPLVDPNTASSVEYIQSKAGQVDYFVTHFDNNGKILWSTCFGGDGSEDLYPLPMGQMGNERAGGIVVDKNNKVYIVGNTASSTALNYPNSYPKFPIKSLGAGKFLDNTYNGGDKDGFIARFSASYALEWSTYIGTNHHDDITGLSTNGANRLYLMTNIYTTPSPNPQIMPSGWPLKQQQGYFYQNIFVPGQSANNYYRGGAITQFLLDGTLYYSTYYGAIDFSVNNIANRTDDNQFYFVGVAQQYAEVLCTNTLSTNPYWYPELLPTALCSNPLVGQFSMFCVSCQRQISNDTINLASPKIAIYPNPFSDKIILNNPNQDRVLEVEWLDLMGRTIYKESLFIENVLQELTTNSLAAGTYLLRVKTGKQVFTYKMIKQ